MIRKENDIKSTKKDARFYFDLGNSYYSQNQYILAIENYSKSIDLDPDNHDVYHNAGIICVELDKYDMAIHFLEKAISLNSKNDNNYYFLGLSYEITGNHKKAVENYTMATTLNPGHSSASMALEGLSHFINLSIDDSNLHYEMALEALNKNEYDSAIENLKQTINLNPEHADGHFQLAKYNYETSEYFLALEHFNKAISIRPEYADNITYKALKTKLKDEKNVIKLLTSLKNRLNNLSPRNRSLRLMRISKEWNFDLHSLEDIEINASHRILNCLIEDVKSISLMSIKQSSCIYSDIDCEEKTVQIQKKLFNHLNSLNRKSKSLENETGIYDLFIGYPFIECLTTDGTYLRAPLLLNPCRLEKVNTPFYGWTLKTDNEFHPIFNNTLFMALNKFNNTVIPEEFHILEKEIEEKNLLEWTLNYFKENNIPIVVEKELDNFIEKIPELKKDDIPDLPQGKIYIKPHAVLGIFPQSTSNLRPDYEKMIEDPDTIDSILELLGKKENGNIITPINYSDIDLYSEKDKFPITNTDESQDRILTAFRKNQNFVVHGPPGTGKSHTILNIIAEAIANNKKVLVVCQKRAALDVIYNRLSSEGFGDYLALVNDHERDKKHIFSKLKNLIDSARKLVATETVFSSENQLEQLSKNIDIAISQLNDLANIQQKVLSIGLSPYEIYCKLANIDTDVTIKLEKPNSIKDYNGLTEEIKPIIELAQYYEKFEHNNYLLKDRKNWANKDPNFKLKLYDTINQIIDINNTIINLQLYLSQDYEFFNQNLSSDVSLFVNTKILIESILKGFNSPSELLIWLKTHDDMLCKIIDKLKGTQLLLETNVTCGLTITQLLEYNAEINNDKTITLSGYENNLTYNDLDNCIATLCQLIKLLQNHETDNNILIIKNRTNWSEKKIDMKGYCENIFNDIIKNSNDIELNTSKIKDLGLNLNDLRDNSQLIKDSIELCTAIQTCNKIYTNLKKWEKALFPQLNYASTYEEANEYINSLNNNRWNIFKDLDYDTSENLFNNLKTYTKTQNFLKFLIPGWWKAKKSINNILKQFGLEITTENLGKTIEKAGLTYQYSKLQQIIKYDLAFLKIDETQKEYDIVNDLKIILPFFNTFKDYNNSILRIIGTFDNIDHLKSRLNTANEYIQSLNDCLNSLQKLQTILSEDFLNDLICKLNNNDSLSNHATKMLNDIKCLDSIISLDKLYYSLTETQHFILDSLMKKFNIQSNDLETVWKDSIRSSFLISWLNQEKLKHPDLNSISSEELLLLSKVETTTKFETTLSNIEKLIVNKRKLHTCISELSSDFNETFINNYLNETNDANKIKSLSECILQLTNDTDNLIKMDTIKESLSSTQRYLLEEVSKKCDRTSIYLSDRWNNTIIKSYLEMWLKSVEEDYPVLTSISTRKHETLVNKLKDDYNKKLITTKNYIHALLETKLKKLPATDSIRGSIKLKDLEYQVNKKRQLWPLRKLMDIYGKSIILELMPCWLMSPESVSSVMPYEHNLFDLVIFDEASQCPQEYALPSIVRSKQIIISGDEKQLSPLNIFHTSIEEEYEDEVASEAQSLLDLAKAIYPTYLLNWHYRSKYEELINFSNHAFYNGKIQIAPNAETEIKPPAIEWIEVKDGLWIKNTNKAEAQSIVDYISKIIKKNGTSQSIGIITFNTTQQNLILDLIDKKEIEDPSFAKALAIIKQEDLDKQLFVKNIENVQGDERDLIIFSIGYSRDFQGKVLANFGLLNRAGGENRLNVAISRARERIVVFCSVFPEDFKVDNSKHNGPKLFKNYLEYSLSSSKGFKEKTSCILQSINPHRSDSNNKNTFYNSFEQEIYEELTSKGFKVKTQVGSSDYKVDLAISDPNDSTKLILGIECDGTNYYNSNSARSRNITRKEFLALKGWNIEHIWSRNWCKNRKDVINQIVDKINRLSNG